MTARSQKSSSKSWQMEYVIYRGNIQRNVHSSTVRTCFRMQRFCEAPRARSRGSVISYILCIREEMTMKSTMLMRNALSVDFNSIIPVCRASKNIVKPSVQPRYITLSLRKPSRPCRKIFVMVSITWETYDTVMHKPMRLKGVVQLSPETEIKGYVLHLIFDQTLVIWKMSI